MSTFTNGSESKEELKTPSEAKSIYPSDIHNQVFAENVITDNCQNFEIICDYETNIEENLKKIRCHMSQKSYNQEKLKENKYDIYHCSCRNLIICSSCKEKCHESNSKCNPTKYLNKLNKMFICGCDHDYKKVKEDHTNCKFQSVTPEDDYCQFCDLICKSLLFSKNTIREKKYKTSDFIDIDKKIILANKKISNIILFPKNTNEEIDTLLICKCQYFYHKDIYYQIVFYQKIISNFALNPDMNLFQMFYEKRDELLKLMFKPLQEILEEYKPNDFNPQDEEIEKFEKFEKENGYLKTLILFFNDDLTTVLSSNTDFFISCKKVQDYINCLEDFSKLINSLVKVKKIEFFYILKGELLEFYRKYYINPKITIIFPLIGLDQNTNPIHRLLFADNKSEFFSSIGNDERNFKITLDKIYEMVISSMSCFDACVKLMKEYLFYVEIMILYQFPKEDLKVYLKNIERIIHKLPHNKREKLKVRVEKIAYYILLIYNDYYVSDYLFVVEEMKNKFSFETASETSNYIMSLIFDTKKSIVNEGEVDKESKNVQSVELFDLLLNENDYYLESLNSIYNTVNFQYFGIFLNQNLLDFRNKNFCKDILNNEITTFFGEIEKLQNQFYRKRITNEVFFKESLKLFDENLKSFANKKTFIKDLGDSDDHIYEPQINLQLKLFKFGYIEKIVIFLRNFLEVSYFVQYKEADELNKLFDTFFKLIVEHFCYDNPFLISLFFNTNFFNYFFPNLVKNTDDEFSENDQMEDEIFAKKTKLYYLFLKNYSDFLNILRKFKYKIDTKYILERLFEIVMKNITKIDIPTINNFLKLFILCIQVNINKTNEIVQQYIVNFIRIIINNSSKVKLELESFLYPIYSNDCNKNFGKLVEKKTLFKRIFKLLMKLNSNYFNFIFTNTELFRNFKLDSNNIAQIDPHLNKYFLCCYAKYYFSNFYQIKEVYTYTDAKTLDIINFSDHMVIKDLTQIDDYLNIIDHCYLYFFEKIDSEFNRNIDHEFKSKLAYEMDFRLLLSFYNKVIGVPLFLIIFKIQRTFEIILKGKTEEELFETKVKYIIKAIQIFLKTFKELKKRILKRHYESDSNLFNDNKKRDILNLYIFNEEIFKEHVDYEKTHAKNLDEDLQDKLNSSVVNIDIIINKLDYYRVLFFPSGHSQQVEKEMNNNFFLFLKKVINKYKERKKIFEKNNIIYSIFSDRVNNGVMMKNICEDLLSIVCEDIEELNQDEVDEDDEGKKVYEAPEVSEVVLETKKETNLKLIEDEIRFQKDDPLKRRMERSMTQFGSATIDIKLQKRKTLDLDEMREREKNISTGIRKSELKDVSFCYKEKYLIAYECIIKLFKIDPEFFQIILVNYRKTGNLIRRIAETEIIFLLQPLFNDFYSLEPVIPDDIKPSSFRYLTHIIEFLRLFCEKFNKMFKSLFFQLKFEYYVLSNAADADDEEDIDEEEEEEEENLEGVVLKRLGKIKKKYYFMNLIFKIFSAIITHINHFEKQKQILMFFKLKPLGPEYFSLIFDDMTSFLIETIQGNVKENFELLNSSLTNFLKNCCGFIDEIKIDQNDYHDILTKILKILLELFQEGEVPTRMKNNILKKINSTTLMNILIYKTKILKKLCDLTNIDDSNQTTTIKEVENTFKNYFIDLKGESNDMKTNPATSDKSEDHEKDEDDNEDDDEDDEGINDDEELGEKNLKLDENKIVKIKPYDVFNLEIDHDYHKKLLHLYVILFSSKLNNKSINLIINEEKPNSDDKALSNEEKEKKVNKISDKITQRIENDSVCEIKQESTSNYVETIFTLCTKIYQYFYIIQTFNDEACKYIQFFEKARDEIIEFNKFSLYNFLYELIYKDKKKEVSKTTITKNEIYMFYSSIVKSIEVVHRLKIISDEIDDTKYEHIFKNFELEMIKTESGISNEESVIRKIIFLVDPICIDLHYSEALDLIERQKFEESTNLLSFVINHIEDFKNLAAMRNKIKLSKKTGKFKTFEKCEKIEFIYLQIINLLFGVMCNVRLITTVSLNVDNQLINQNDSLLVLLTILHFIQILISLVIYLYIHLVKLSHVIEESRNSNDSEERKFWTKEQIYLKVMDILYQDEIFYIIWNLVFISILITFQDYKFLYSLLIFPIFQFIPVIQDILHAVKLRAGQFLSAGIIIVVMVFFYAIIGLYFFKDKLIDPETGVRYFIIIIILTIY